MTNFENAAPRSSAPFGGFESSRPDGAAPLLPSGGSPSLGAAESGEDNSSSGSFSNGAEGADVNPDLDAIEAALSVSELGMASIGPGLRDDAHDFMTAGLAYEKAFPEQSAKLMEKMAADPELFALAFQYLARQGREQRLTNPASSRKENRMSEHYVAPSKRQQLQDRIEDIMKEHPPGSREYSSAKVQRELSSLHSALYGDGPADRGADPYGLSTE